MADIQKVLILYDGDNYGGDFGRSFAGGFRANGCEVTLHPQATDWDEHFDLVLAYGPFGARASMMPVAKRLLQRGAQRPLFAWWLTEGVPALWLPHWSVRMLGCARLLADRGLGAQGKRWWARGHRLRILAELRWLHARGVLDVLAVTSASRASYVQAFGLRPIVVPLGYDPAAYGTDLGLPRDIYVCFIGSTGSRRRRDILQTVRRDLERRSIPLTVRTDLYGAERTQFLNRNKIMLNILRAPQDFVGQRLLLGAANKTLIVSEPMRDSQPFVPGHHLVVSPIARLAETIEHYLAHDAERESIVAEAHRLVTEELTIKRMTGRILAQADRLSQPSGQHLQSVAQA